MKKQIVQEKERFSFCKGIVKKYLNPKWFRHEALHTTSVLMESIQQHIVEHHYCLKPKAKYSPYSLYKNRYRD